MCYQVIERYSVCKCLYYSHSPDLCAAYESKNHPLLKRTVLVGYSCEQHSKNEETLWSEGYREDGYGSQPRSGSQRRDGSKRSMTNASAKITSAVALKALADAKAKEGEINLPARIRIDELANKANSPALTATTATMTKADDDIEDHSQLSSLASSVDNHEQILKTSRVKSIPRSILDDFRFRIRQPHEYIAALWTAERRVCDASTVGFHKKGNLGFKRTYYSSLRNLNKQLKKEGRVPKTEKGDTLSSQSQERQVQQDRLSEQGLLQHINGKSAEEEQSEEENSENKPRRGIHIGGTYQSYISYPDVPSDLEDIIPTRLSDSPFSTDSTNTSDDEITTICDVTRTRNPCACEDLNVIRMCRNIALRTFLNLKILQESKIYAGNFSVVVLDRYRPTVASLVTIEDADFMAFVFELEYVLRDSAALVLDAARDTFDSEVEAFRRVDIDSRHSFLGSPMILKFCRSLLDYDFSVSPNDSSDESCPGVISTLMSLVLILDIAVASYAGSHCSDTLAEYCSPTTEHDISQPFKPYSKALQQPGVKLRRCRLECLDAFHCGAGIWVFCLPDCEPSSRLYVSADVDAFGDIWGPLWKWKRPSPSGTYSAYLVGNGSIVRSTQTDLTPVPVSGEVLCHWMSNEYLEPDDNAQLHERYLPFHGTERLLIGVPSCAEELWPRAWPVNKQCFISISKVRERLQEARRLCIVGASRPFHYNDSNQYQLQIGYSGVNASVTRQYKRMPGRTLKDVLLELWALTPELRDPRLLEDLHGVEVSMCTNNAQRISLSQILCLDSMRHLLRRFNWSDPAFEKEYYATLEDPSRPIHSPNPAFKEDFDSAVMLGLQMLSKTGLDRKQDLSIFLSSTCTPKPELATLTSKEHSWIGFLKDTTTECAMIAFGNTCMGSKDIRGLSCGKSRAGALLTAMVLPDTPDMSSDQEEDLHLRSLSQRGKDFPLGDRGVFRLKMCFKGALIVVWDPPSLKSVLINKISSTPAVHREFTEIDHSENPDAGQGHHSRRPLPIVIVSDKWKEEG